MGAAVRIECILLRVLYWSPILTRAHARSISRTHGRLTASKHERDARVMMTWWSFRPSPTKRKEFKTNSIFTPQSTNYVKHKVNASLTGRSPSPPLPAKIINHLQSLSPSLPYTEEKWVITSSLRNACHISHLVVRHFQRQAWGYFMHVEDGNFVIWRIREWPARFPWKSKESRRPMEFGNLKGTVFCLTTVSQNVAPAIITSRTTLSR